MSELDDLDQMVESELRPKKRVVKHPHGVRSFTCPRGHAKAWFGSPDRRRLDCPVCKAASNKRRKRGMSGFYLKAAAPALLEALELIASTDLSVIAEGPLDPVDYMRRTARAAIALAKGEQK